MKEHEINTEIIDLILPPEYIQDFISRNFPSHHGKIQSAKIWQLFRAENDGRNTPQSHTGRTALYYAFERDGWRLKRYADTTYFILPGKATRQGRPADSEVIKQLKERIRALEAENTELKKTIREARRKPYIR